jgi:hypothetical protein
MADQVHMQPMDEDEDPGPVPDLMQPDDGVLPCSGRCKPTMSVKQRADATCTLRIF